MLKNLVWRFFGQKYLLGGAVALNKALEGKRTLLVTIATVIVYTVKVLGYLPPDLADAMLALLAGAGSQTLIAKFTRWDSDYKLTARAAELQDAARKEIAEAVVRGEASGAEPKVSGTPAEPKTE